MMEFTVHAKRQDSPPKLLNVIYSLKVDSDEPDHRLNLLHENIRKYGTVYNTLSLGTEIQGELVRAQPLP